MIRALVAAILLLQGPAPEPPAAPAAAPSPRTPRAVPTPPAPPSPPPAPRSGLLVGEWPAKASGRRVALTEKMDVDEALGRIADAAGWNLVANTGHAGDRPVILSLRNVPVEEALESVLEGTGLVATRRGETVTVAPGLAARAETPVLSGFEKPTGKRVTADFSDVPLDRALRQIADAGGLSLVLPPGIRGSVTAHFRDTPVEDALRAVLAQNGLSASREGAVLTVARESGPSLVIRGGKRRLEFSVDTDEVRAQAEEARRDADEALSEAGGRTGRHGRHRDRVVSGDVIVGPGERVRDVVALRGNVRLDPGAQARDVVAVMGSVDLGPGAQVEKDVVAVGGDVHVSPGAHVAKDAVSVGGSLVIDPGGEVEGEQTSIAVPGLRGLLGAAGWTLGLRPRSPFLFAGQVLTEFALFFALGLISLMLFPRRLEAVAASLAQAPAKAGLMGFLGTLALPVLALLLVATVVGIPLVAVEVLGVLVAAVLGFAALALVLGRRLPVRVERGAGVLQLAIGTALLVVAVNLPFFGALVWIVCWIAVFGAVLRTRFGRAEAVAAIPPAPPVPPTPPAPPAAPA